MTDGLYGIITVKIPEPQFEGQTKGRLGNSYVRGAVEDMTYDYLKNYFAENPEEQLEQDLLQNLQRKLSLEKMFSLEGYCQVNLPTVAKEENMEQSYSSWRETLHEEVQNLVVIVNFKQSFH